MFRGDLFVDIQPQLLLLPVVVVVVICTVVLTTVNPVVRI